MKTQVTWLVCGILAHVTLAIDDPARSYSIAWLMGPDGEQCLTPHSLLGPTVVVGSDGFTYPNVCETSYADALAFVHAELKDEWVR